MRTFILLTLVALAFSSPIDDKKTPDISTLPLKKDDVKNATGKVIDSYTQDGVHASPLHKRDTQHVASSPVVTDHNASGLAKNAPQSSTSAPVTKSQVPLINHERQSSTAVNNQKTVPAVGSTNTKTAPVAASSPSVTSSSSATNEQKSSSDHVAPRPLSQSNVQPNLASSSRVRRDAPRPTDLKTSTLNTQQPSTLSKTQQLPAPSAPKTSQVTPQQSKTSPVVPAKVQAPVQGSRVTRDTPKPVDTKTAPQPASATGQKSSAQASPASKPIAPSAKAPTFDAKAPAPVAAKSPAVAPTNSRKTREAPNPHEQSKIVPSSTNIGAQLSKDASPLTPAVAAKSPAQTPVHKRESPASNLRGDSQQSSSSSSNNQSPQFVHPVPVDQVLRNKPAPAPAAPVTVTKTTETVQITPALPTTETKTVEVPKVDAHKAAEAPKVDAKH